MHPLAVEDRERSRRGEARAYNCAVCGHTVDRHPVGTDGQNPWTGEWHVVQPCGDCACAHYVPAR